MVHIVVQEVPEQIGATTTLRSFSEVMELLHAGIAMHVMLTRDDHSSRFQEGELVRIYGISTDGFFSWAITIVFIWRGLPLHRWFCGRQQFNSIRNFTGQHTIGI